MIHETIRAHRSRCSNKVNCHRNSAQRSSLVDPVIFVGGAGDASSEIVKGYAAEYAAKHPGVIVKYYSWEDKQEIIDFVNSQPKGTPLTIVGHSYGGDTAAKVVAALAGKFDLLITADPVSRFNRPDFNTVARSVKTWVDIDAVRTGASWSNALASMGGDWGTRPHGYATTFNQVPTDHADFRGMMSTAPPF